MSDAPHSRSGRARVLRSGAAFVLSVGLWLLLMSLAAVILHRNDVRLDLSHDQRRSLSPQSQETLELLDRPVHILAFFNEAPQEQALAARMLRRYQEASSNFDFEFIDLDRRPELAELHGVSLNRTLVITSGGLEIKLHEPSEAELTSALLRVMMDRPPRVLVIRGHGEASIDDENRGGIHDLAELIRRQNFQLESFDLLGAPRIPAEADAVILPSPEGRFTQHELDALTAYLLQGGRLLAMLEPAGSRQIDSLMTHFGLVADETFVVDPSDERRNITGAGSFRIALAQGGDPRHPITEGFTYATLYPIARSLATVQPPPPGVTPTRIVASMPNAWGESDLMLLAQGEPSYQEGVDRAGPVGLAYAIELDLRRFTPVDSERGLTGTLRDFYPETMDIRGAAEDTVRVAGAEILAKRRDQARLVVVGDVDFVNNANLLAWGNSDLLLNMLLWLTEREGRVSIAARPELFDPIALTSAQIRWIRILSIGVVPGIPFVLAFSVVWRRRKWL